MRTFAQKPKDAKQTKSAKSTKPNRALSGQSRAVQSILHLQRTIGNQAVQRLLQSNAEELQAGAASTASTRFSHDFSRISIFSPSPVQVQPKLTINTPGDKYEQEADRVASQVIRLPKPYPQHDFSSSGGLKEQDANEQLRTKFIQKHDLSEGAPPIVQDVISSHGQPLDPEIRSFFEPRFGHDFSRVKVHTDSKADRSALALNARAYTFGKDIIFGKGQYTPQTGEGKRILAHELTHVVQQEATATNEPVIQRDCLDPSITFGLPVTQPQRDTTFRNFPNLRRGNCRILSSGGDYNCYGWAAGVIQNIRTNHDIINFLLESHPTEWESRAYRVHRSNEITIEGLRALFQGAVCPLTCTEGRSETADVLIYSNGSGPQHAARRSAETCALLNEVMYESKMGSGPLLLHLDRELEGGGYGNITHHCTYRPPCTQQPSIPNPVGVSGVKP